MKSILVTGGAGYIGSHACKRLALAGFLPICFDNLSTGHADFVRWGPLIQGDLADTILLSKLLAEYQPLAVLHFAASALVGESMHNPSLYYRNNVAGSLSLFEAMRDNDVRTIVFSSSCATYGHPQSLPITESHPQQPISPYGRSKYMVEQMLNDFAQAHGFRATSLRYFNAAGADRDLEIGERHNPETHLIPSLIEALLGQRSHCSLYGSDFETPDGSAIRDYIHVEDLADAHLLALQWLLNEPSGHYTFNLGTGTGHSVLQVAEMVQSCSPKKLPLTLEPRRSGDPAFLLADAANATKILRWMPMRSNLHQIISSAWSWHSNSVG